MRTYRHAGWWKTGVMAAILLSAPAFPTSGAQPRNPDRGPFTGFLKIRQKNGSLSYEFTVVRGKVTSGTVTNGSRRPPDSDIVGGWYNRKNLVLLVQTRGEDVGDPWSSHAHQFRKTEEGFELEHTLFGYGKTIDSGIVYRPHVVERMVEVGEGEGRAGGGDDRDE